MHNENEKNKSIKIESTSTCWIGCAVHEGAINLNKCSFTLSFVKEKDVFHYILCGVSHCTLSAHSTAYNLYGFFTDILRKTPKLNHKTLNVDQSWMTLSIQRACVWHWLRYLEVGKSKPLFISQKLIKLMEKSLQPQTHFQIIVIITECFIWFHFGWKHETTNYQNFVCTHILMCDLFSIVRSFLFFSSSVFSLSQKSWYLYIHI